MDSTHLKRLCLGEVSRILEVTGRLVNMDSGSDDVDALNEKAEVLRRLFAAAGAEVELWAADPPREKTWNVVSVFRGNGTARILILTHYDTVFPRGEAARRPFHSDGENAWGPGVADMQASLAMLLSAVPLLRQHADAPFHTLTVFSSADEELGSWGSRRQIEELAARHDITLNMEMSGAGGDLITVSGRGMANCRIVVTGRAAHSAAEPPAGVNAGLELCWQLLQISKLSDPAARTAVNATMGSFGSKPNIIPDRAEALINIRYARKEELDRVERDIRKCIGQKHFEDSVVSLSMQEAFPPFGNSPAIVELADKVRALAREHLGLELGYRHAFGGNDTAFSCRVCPSLDGFGPGSVSIHSENEHLPIATLAPRLCILLLTLNEICLGRMVPLDRSGFNKAEDHAEK